MAFPSSQGSTQSLGDVWRNVRGLAGNTKAVANQLRASTNAGPVTAIRILEFFAELANVKARFQSAAAVPGLADYARDQLGNTNLDIVLEFNTMLAQIDATLQWGITNLPMQGGFVQVLTLPASGVYTWRTFSSAETTGLRGRLDALIATID